MYSFIAMMWCIKVFPLCLRQSKSLYTGPFVSYLYYCNAQHAHLGRQMTTIFTLNDNLGSFYCLLFLPNVPGSTFIQGGTFIPDFRVGCPNKPAKITDFVSQKDLTTTGFFRKTLASSSITRSNGDHT
jgi:hypothetical protein